jgi:tetratricopeptide (TPR) repeat protein
VRFLYGGPSWLAFPPISPEDEGTRLGLLAYSLLTGRRMPLYTSAETVRSLLEDPDIPSVWKPFLHRMCLPSSDTRIWEEALVLLEHTELAPTNPDAWKMRHAAPDQSTDTHTQTHDAIGPNNTVPPQPSFPIPWWKHRVVRLGAAALSGFILLTAIGWSATRMWMSDTASSFPISSANAKQAAIWYNQSLSAYQAKQYDRALDLGKKALAADPGRQGYYLHVAKLYQIRGDFQHGVQIMKQAVKMFPQDPAMQDGLAMQAYYAKDFMTAKAAISKAVQINPSNPGYFHHNAKILGALGDYTHAADMMKKAIALDNSQPYYYYDLSIYQYRDDDILFIESKLSKFIYYKGLA